MSWPDLRVSQQWKKESRSRKDLKVILINGPSGRVSVVITEFMPIYGERDSGDLGDLGDLETIKAWSRLSFSPFLSPSKISARRKNTAKSCPFVDTIEEGRKRRANFEPLFLHFGASLYHSCLLIQIQRAEKDGSSQSTNIRQNCKFFVWKRVLVFTPKSQTMFSWQNKIVKEKDY